MAPPSQFNADGPRPNPRPSPTLVERPITDDVCQRLLSDYEADIAGRMAAGFVLSAAAPPGPHDFDPPNGIFLVAYHASTPVGCGGLRRIAPRTGEIRRMYVVPEARGLGIGRLLLARLEDAARERGHEIIRLDTSEELTEAHKLYENAGYERIPAYNDNTFAARWYEKRVG